MQVGVVWQFQRKGTRSQITAAPLRLDHSPTPSQLWLRRRRKAAGGMYNPLPSPPNTPPHANSQEGMKLAQLVNQEAQWDSG